MQKDLPLADTPTMNIDSKMINADLSQSLDLLTMSSQQQQPNIESGKNRIVAEKSGSPKGLFVLAKNGKRRCRLPAYMIQQCHTLECVLDVFDDTSNDPIPLPITEECLKFMFKYANLFASEDFPPYKRPGHNKLFPSNFNKFFHGQLLLTLDLKHLAILYKAADYLQFDRLLDDITKCLMYHLDFEYTFKGPSLPQNKSPKTPRHNQWTNKTPENAGDKTIICTQGETPVRPLFYPKPNWSL
uniref:Uncharacterized protein n=1 Tax=Panagrolaimus sp. ES5 TaxID=591445 RepID=A0AC34FJD6_9BILA